MRRIYSVVLLICCVLTSCSNWLDVMPKTSIKEENLFESEAGFKDALTGFYLKMGTESLYAKELTFGYIDMLARTYTEMPNITNPTVLYSYDGDYKGMKDVFFRDMYNIIANINNFLSFLEKIGTDVVKTGDYRQIMEGEALGLRAFLHFDLLRMFGPVYSENPQALSIPYRFTFDNEATGILPAETVVDNILKDLHKADSLLASTDTKLFHQAGKTDDVFLAMRQLRMNTYAVKAMLARVYCYKGDAESKTLAFKYAEEVVKCGEFTLCEDVTTKDRILFSEHIFSLHVYELDKIVRAEFDKSPETDILSLNPSMFEKWFERTTGGNTDFRCKGVVFKDVKPNIGEVKKVMNKYDQSGYEGMYSGAEIIPLIRLPEMYYIMAECDPNSYNSASYINTIRLSRQIPSSDAIDGNNPNYDKLDNREGLNNGQTMRINELMKEYRKEFYGEGQLFYFYKRFNYRTFLNAAYSDMRGKYVFTLPEDEIIFGNANK